MSRSSATEVRGILQAAKEVYREDRVATRVLDDLDARLREPVRIAVAGMVKAGKSTLLNALIGERVAPTDAGECTRAVTWYRHGHTPRITAHLVDGTRRVLPIERVDGRVDLSRTGIDAADTDHIDIRWPAESLRGMVLIDTPGIGSLSRDTSARSISFLTDPVAVPEADAAIYLLRHLHATDLQFLEALSHGRDHARGMAVLAVLSRADEIGSGRIDSMLSSTKIADRYRRDGELGALALNAVPVAGLLAEAARTLREEEFAAFRKLAALDRATRDGMLVSVDRFLQPMSSSAPTVEERRRLLERFGVFGVRVAIALVRGGVQTSSALAERLVIQSGLNDVEEVVATQFRARAAALKARAVLDGLEALLRERPWGADADLRRRCEQVRVNLHELTELAVLGRLRTEGAPWGHDVVREAERILGAAGLIPHRRLGITEELPPAQLRQHVDGMLRGWRTRAEAPTTDRAMHDLCRVVVRSIEGAAEELPGFALAGR
ncbi:dynamin family protein [Microbacterium sp. GXF7504]